MSQKMWQRVMEMGTGPTSIKWQPPGGDLELAGYLFVQLDPETQVYHSYFAMRPEVPIPLPTSEPGSKACFTAIEQQFESPEQFYEWVLSEGGIGEEVYTQQAEETYSDWDIG